MGKLKILREVERSRQAMGDIILVFTLLYVIAFLTVDIIDKRD